MRTSRLACSWWRRLFRNRSSAPCRRPSPDVCKEDAWWRYVDRLVSAGGATGGARVRNHPQLAPTALLHHALEHLPAVAPAGVTLRDADGAAVTLGSLYDAALRARRIPPDTDLPDFAAALAALTPVVLDLRPAPPPPPPADDVEALPTLRSLRVVRQPWVVGVDGGWGCAEVPDEVALAALCAVVPPYFVSVHRVRAVVSAAAYRHPLPPVVRRWLLLPPPPARHPSCAVLEWSEDGLAVRRASWAQEQVPGGGGGDDRGAAMGAYRLLPGDPAAYHAALAVVASVVPTFFAPVAGGDGAVAQRLREHYASPPQTLSPAAQRAREVLPNVEAMVSHPDLQAVLELCERGSQRPISLAVPAAPAMVAAAAPDGPAAAEPTPAITTPAPSARGSLHCAVHVPLAGLLVRLSPHFAHTLRGLADRLYERPRCAPGSAGLPVRRIAVEVFPCGCGRVEAPAADGGADAWTCLTREDDGWGGGGPSRSAGGTRLVAMGVERAMAAAGSVESPQPPPSAGGDTPWTSALLLHVAILSDAAPSSELRVRQRTIHMSAASPTAVQLPRAIEELLRATDVLGILAPGSDAGLTGAIAAKNHTSQRLAALYPLAVLSQMVGCPVGDASLHSCALGTVLCAQLGVAADWPPTAPVSALAASTVDTLLAAHALLSMGVREPDGVVPALARLVSLTAEQRADVAYERRLCRYRAGSSSAAAATIAGSTLAAKRAMLAELILQHGPEPAVTAGPDVWASRSESQETWTTSSPPPQSPLPEVGEKAGEVISKEAPSPAAAVECLDTPEPTGAPVVDYDPIERLLEEASRLPRGGRVGAGAGSHALAVGAETDLLDSLLESGTTPPVPRPPQPQPSSTPATTSVQDRPLLSGSSLAVEQTGTDGFLAELPPSYTATVSGGRGGSGGRSSLPPPSTGWELPPLRSQRDSGGTGPPRYPPCAPAAPLAPAARPDLDNATPPARTWRHGAHHGRTRVGRPSHTSPFALTAVSGAALGDEQGPAAAPPAPHRRGRGGGGASFARLGRFPRGPALGSYAAVDRCAPALPAPDERAPRGPAVDEGDMGQLAADIVSSTSRSSGALRKSYGGARGMMHDRGPSYADAAGLRAFLQTEEGRDVLRQLLQSES